MKSINDHIEDLEKSTRATLGSLTWPGADALGKTLQEALNDYREDLVVQVVVSKRNLEKAIDTLKHIAWCEADGKDCVQAWASSCLKDLGQIE